MSFLDATGLGTFWNKLKSTFQGPVSEVYKDALTPVNLFYNSDFSKGGGVPSNYLFGLFDTAVTDSVFICDGVVYRSGSNQNNLRFIRENKSITVSGTRQADGTTTARIYSYSTKLKAGHTYTMAFTGKINSYTLTKVSMNVFYANSVQTIINTDPIETLNEETTVRAIFIPTVDTDASVGITVQGIGDYSVTISKIRFYEGSFLNPPDFEYPEFCKASASGTPVNAYTPTRLINHNTSNKIWIRAARLFGDGCADLETLFDFNVNQTLSAMSIWEGYVIRPWRHGSITVAVKIRCVLNLINVNATHRYSYSLTAERFTDNNSDATQLNQVRIAYSYDNNNKLQVWLEVRSAYVSNGNPIWINPIISTCIYGGNNRNTSVYNFNTSSDCISLNYGDSDTSIVTITPTNASTAFTIS